MCAILVKKIVAIQEVGTASAILVHCILLHVAFKRLRVHFLAKRFSIGKTFGISRENNS